MVTAGQEGDLVVPEAGRPWSDLDNVHVLLVAARADYDERRESSGSERLDQAISLVEKMTSA